MATTVVALGDQRRRREAMDRLVTEIAEADDTDDSFVLSIRDALERGWASTFEEALADARKKKEAAIERVCSKHYLELLRAIQEVHDIKVATVELKKVAYQLFQEFGATGTDLLTLLRQLEQYTVDQQKSKRLAETAAYCRELCALMARAKEQIADGDHYGATRSLDIVRAEYRGGCSPVPVVEARVARWLPMAIDVLLVQVKREMDVFLKGGLHSAALVGETMLRRQATASLHALHRQQHGEGPPPAPPVLPPSAPPCGHDVSLSLLSVGHMARCTGGRGATPGPGSLAACRYAPRLELNLNLNPRGAHHSY